MTYYDRTVRPSRLVEVVVRHDVVIASEVQRLMVVGVDSITPSIQQQVQLPLRLGGLGLQGRAPPTAFSKSFLMWRSRSTMRCVSLAGLLDLRDAHAGCMRDACGMPRLQVSAVCQTRSRLARPSPLLHTAATRTQWCLRQRVRRALDTHCLLRPCPQLFAPAPVFISA